MMDFLSNIIALPPLAKVTAKVAAFAYEFCET